LAVGQFNRIEPAGVLQPSGAGVKRMVLRCRKLLLSAKPRSGTKERWGFHAGVLSWPLCRPNGSHLLGNFRGSQRPGSNPQSDLASS